MIENNDSPNREITILPNGDSCDKCDSTKKVQKFNGSFLCKACRNQWAEIN